MVEHFVNSSVAEPKSSTVSMADHPGKALDGYRKYLEKNEVDLSKVEEKDRNQRYLKDCFRSIGMPRGYLDAVELPRYQIKVEEKVRNDGQEEQGDQQQAAPDPPPPPPFPRKAQATCCMVLKQAAPRVMESAIFNTENRYPDDLAKLWTTVFSYYRVSTRATRQLGKSAFLNRRKKPDESYMKFREELLNERNALNAILTRDKEKLDDIDYIDHLLFCLSIDNNAYTEVIRQIDKEGITDIETVRNMLVPVAQEHEKKQELVAAAKEKDNAKSGRGKSRQRDSSGGSGRGKRKGGKGKSKCPCPFFQKGRCLKGTKCDWSHDLSLPECRNDNMQQGKSNDSNTTSNGCSFCGMKNHNVDKCARRIRSQKKAREDVKMVEEKLEADRLAKEQGLSVEEETSKSVQEQQLDAAILQLESASVIDVGMVDSFPLTGAVEQPQGRVDAFGAIESSELEKCQGSSTRNVELADKNSILRADVGPDNGVSGAVGEKGDSCVPVVDTVIGDSSKPAPSDREFSSLSDNSNSDVTTSPSFSEKLEENPGGFSTKRVEDSNSLLEPLKRSLFGGTVCKSVLTTVLCVVCLLPFAFAAGYHIPSKVAFDHAEGGELAVIGRTILVTSACVYSFIVFVAHSFDWLCAGVDILFACASFTLNACFYAFNSPFYLTSYLLRFVSVLGGVMGRPGYSAQTARWISVVFLILSLFVVTTNGDPHSGFGLENEISGDVSSGFGLHGGCGGGSGCLPTAQAEN